MKLRRKVHNVAAAAVSLRSLDAPVPRITDVESDQRYVKADSSNDRWDLDGVVWNKAPLPPERHGCWSQTVGYIRLFTRIDRCACGATMMDADGFWIHRNERKPA